MSRDELRQNEGEGIELQTGDVAFDGGVIRDGEIIPDQAEINRRLKAALSLLHWEIGASKRNNNEQ